MDDGPSRIDESLAVIHRLSFITGHLSSVINRLTIVNGPSSIVRTMRILIVEDDEMRCAWFKQKFAGRVLDVTCDVRQAARWLDEREYELILLDHDLSDE